MVVAAVFDTARLATVIAAAWVIAPPELRCSVVAMAGANAADTFSAPPSVRPMLRVAALIKPASVLLIASTPALSRTAPRSTVFAAVS